MNHRIHIVGRKNHGKTTFVTALIAELRSRGLRVGSVKHSGHQHELDRPGSDSHGHREAGASPAAVISKNLIAAFTPRPPDEDPFEVLAPLYEDCDVVLVEGGHHYPGGVKVEIWRADSEVPCLALDRADIVAVISDGSPEVPVPVWPKDVGAVAEHLNTLMGLGSLQGNNI